MLGAIPSLSIYLQRVVINQRDHFMNMLYGHLESLRSATDQIFVRINGVCFAITTLNMQLLLCVYVTNMTFIT
jgi:hypothetical protein